MKLVQEQNLKAVFPYLDNITICGKDQEDHNKNLTGFLEAAIIRTSSQPGASQSLDTSSKKGPFFRILNGYDHGVSFLFHTAQSPSINAGDYSPIIFNGLLRSRAAKRKSAAANHSPQSQETVKAFESLKKIIEEAVITSIDESAPFETDASDVVLAATLNQNGRPVAFFSRTVQGE